MAINQPTVIQSNTGQATVIQKGGQQGIPGVAATVSVGTVTTVLPSSPASVQNAGTPLNAVLDFEIPQGETGNAATVEIGTVTTLAPGAQATATNAGTPNNLILDLGIPQGPVGPGGSVNSFNSRVGNVTLQASDISGAMTAPDTGAANAYAISLTPAPAALTPGIIVGIQSVVNSNTGTATLSVNGLSALPILLGKGTALSGGELVSGYGALLRLNYAGTAWELIWTGAGEFVPPATQSNAAVQSAQVFLGVPLSSVQQFGSSSLNDGFDNSLITVLSASVVIPSQSRSGKFRITGVVFIGLNPSSSTATGSVTYTINVLDASNSNANINYGDNTKFISTGSVGLQDSFISPYLYSPGDTVTLSVQFQGNFQGTVGAALLTVMVQEA